MGLEDYVANLYSTGQITTVKEVLTCLMRMAGLLGLSQTPEYVELLTWVNIIWSGSLNRMLIRL